MCEEVFGPIASIQVVKDADEAIARAAQSEYGLGANIYTQNLTWAMRAMQEIKAGTFWINDPLTDNDAAPFGGMRKSGMGRELGEEGLDAFRETKHVHLDFVPERKSSGSPIVRVPRRFRNEPIRQRCRLDPEPRLTGAELGVMRERN